LAGDAVDSAVVGDVDVHVRGGAEEGLVEQRAAAAAAAASS
jgi:hypothetical protein